MKANLVMNPINASIKWIPKIKLLATTCARTYFHFFIFYSSSNAVCDPNKNWSKNKSKQSDQHESCSFHSFKYVTRYVTTQVFRMWLTTFSPLIFGWTTK